MKTSVVLPTVTKRPPKEGTQVWFLNINKIAPKLKSLAIVSRKWNGGVLHSRELGCNNVFTSFAAAKSARAVIFRALAENA